MRINRFLAGLFLMGLLFVLGSSPALAARHHRHARHHQHRAVTVMNVDEPLPDWLEAALSYQSLQPMHGRTHNGPGHDPAARLTTTRTVSYVNKHTDDFNQFVISKQDKRDFRLIAADLLRFNTAPIVLKNDRVYGFGAHYVKQDGFGATDVDKEGAFWAAAQNLLAQQANDEVAFRQHH